MYVRAAWARPNLLRVRLPEPQCDFAVIAGEEPTGSNARVDNPLLDLFDKGLRVHSMPLSDGREVPPNRPGRFGRRIARKVITAIASGDPQDANDARQDLRGRVRVQADDRSR